MFEYDIFIALPESRSFGNRDPFTHFPIPIPEFQQRRSDGGLYIWYTPKEFHGLPKKLEGTVGREDEHQ